ncbi:MAG: DUF3160 domain-containing protein [Endomicrobium sp.]|jgi:hypothetical protein|nr:DUF3160 domain-containing protein [Endomicrobium sp.]
MHNNEKYKISQKKLHKSCNAARILTPKKSIFYFFVFLPVFVSCAAQNVSQQNLNGTVLAKNAVFCAQILPSANFTQTQTDSMQQLRLLRGAVFAKYGEIFSETDLRGYFLANDKNYRPDMIKRWNKEFSQNEKQAKEGIFSKTVLSGADAELSAKIDARIENLKKNNFVTRNGYKIANSVNIVNFFKFEDIDGDFLQSLSQNNMAIVRENKKQLFETYIENNYFQIPSFITSDLMLRLYGVYFSYAKNILQSKSKDVSFIDSGWSQCLQALSATNEAYPAFMRLSAWQIKNLNASMAAQTAFKNGGALNFIKKEPAEKPERGSKEKENNANPSDAFTIGFVEPNTAFWQKTAEILDLTVKVLEDNSLLSADLRRKTNKLKDIAGFLYETSVKELNGEILDKRDYERIAWFGYEVQAATYFFLEKQTDLLPELAAASKRGSSVFYNALGNADALYAVVEAGGYLYIAKGAVFSYYEFERKESGKTFSLKDWRKAVEDGKTPDAPSWIKDYIADFVPQPDKKIYSGSGG